MTPRQKQFCLAYAQNGNAAEAARLAGYSPHTARGQGQRLLTNADIKQYLEQLTAGPTAAAIASVEAVQLFWSKVMNDESERTADRLKASELLVKSMGGFIQLQSTEQQEEPQVVIYLPDNGRD